MLRATGSTSSPPFGTTVAIKCTTHASTHRSSFQAWLVQVIVQGTEPAPPAFKWHSFQVTPSKMMGVPRSPSCQR